ncbi:MAG: sporulation protein YqfC [Clostridiaceae bacterium]
MEGRFYKTKETIANRLDMPEDVVLNIPKITITGDKEITIENHKGIIYFEENSIKINTNIGDLTIEGCGLEILYMRGCTLIISGRFSKIIYRE